MNQNKYSRKEFITRMGLSTAALAFSALRFPEGVRHVPSLALQLYTVRKGIEQDLEGTMRKVADIGFLGIETYALPPTVTLKRAAKVFRDCGLEVVAMHTELPTDGQRESILRLAEAYRCKNVIYPGWPEGDKFRSLAATERTTELYNEAAAFLKSKGLRFGLHNHWWEFEKFDGIYPFYYLLEHLTPDVFFEIDTYWVKTGGGSPENVVRNFGKRAPFLHIKDGPAIKGDKAYEQVPAGRGNMDFPSIAQAAGPNTQWMIVEFDEYGGDIFAGIRMSYEFLTKTGLAKGRV